jgi:hypothetical protein
MALKMMDVQYYNSGLLLRGASFPGPGAFA